MLAAYEMPAFARRSLSQVGVGEGFGPDAYGDADGRWLEQLMRRTAAPLPSRWLSITLRRLLLSPVDTPAGVNGADFAAERAWLLLRMGESTAARALVERVDMADMTPKLSQLWMQAMLATGDPGGLCPAVPTALERAPERGWVVAEAMCAALAGPSGSARPLLAAIRRRGVASGADLTLAQKVMGAGANSSEAATVEWEPVTELTAWRWGLATATGVTVPDTLYATAGPQLAGWRAQAAAIPLADRLAPPNVRRRWGSCRVPHCSTSMPLPARPTTRPLRRRRWRTTCGRPLPERTRRRGAARWRGCGRAAAMRG